MKNSERIVDYFITKYGKDKKYLLMPYCHGMWDSMKSLYRSMVDNHMDICVMPIPYYNLIQGYADLKSGMHDDFDKFKTCVNPDHLINFEHFTEYDADYIIHSNPYDSNNSITIAHPMFSSEQLKKRGKKLIYIPYTTATTEDIRLQSGVINSDLIIVSNEEEKGLYIASFKSEGFDISNRIIALGSPKYDNLERKKVVLFCTSIIPFVSNPSKKLLTYRFILNRERGKVIIFRPHPLMIEAIKSKCPEYLNQYLDFLDDAKATCLFSENDLQSCMGIADYLITDVSGITKIWVQTDKPFEILE